MKKTAAVAIVIGLAFVALQGNFRTGAQPWPSHIVAGGVLPSDQGNYSNAVAYLITNTTGPTVVQDTLTPGATPLYQIDIGGVNYDYKTGDEAVVVLETRKGLNGWTGVNWTESAWGVMTSNNQDDLGDTTLQMYPTLATTSAGASLVDISWTGLVNRSTNGNIKGYRLYRWPGPTPVAIINHLPGTLTYRDGPLSDGTYCYQVSVLYRRDVNYTMTYETVGRSDWVGSACRTVSVPPKIASTSPVNDAQTVAVGADIVVNFDKRMNGPTVQWTVVSNPPSTVPTFTANWNTPTDTILTLTHGTAFAICTNYNVTINGQDMFGQGLVAGTVPNPWDFNTICPNPQVAFTSPDNNEVGVGRLANVVINFTKAMDTTAGQWDVAISPAINWLSESWDSGQTQLTLTHNPSTPFTAGLVYTMQVTANDTGGAQLSPNPYIWSFTANTPPTVTIVRPTGGCFCGGRTIDLSWTMSDEKTLQTDLSVKVTYNYTGGQGDVTGPTPGITGYLWTAPVTINALDVHVTVNVTDGSSDSRIVTSSPFEIDSTAPTITDTTPDQGATNIVLTSAIQIVFSEDMNRTSAQNAITIEPTVATITPSWTDSKNLQIAHDPFQQHTKYWVNVSIGAKDDCGIGNNMTQSYSFSFTTGGKQPKPPTLNLPPDSDIGDTSISLSWTQVTQYTDDSVIPSSVTMTYQVWRNGVLQTTISVRTYKDTGLTAQTTYEYFIRALADGTPSVDSNHRNVTTKPTVTPGGGGPDYTWLYILIIVIIIVVVLVVVLLLMRRKKPEAVPPEEAPPEEEAPLEEAPPAEAPPEEAPTAETPPTETPPGEAPPKEQSPPPA